LRPLDKLEARRPAEFPFENKKGANAPFFSSCRLFGVVRRAKESGAFPCGSALPPYSSPSSSPRQWGWGHFPYSTETFSSSKYSMVALHSWQTRMPNPLTPQLNMSY